MGEELTVGKRKIPRAALADLAETCEFMSRLTGEPAGEILKGYLGLMDKYDYYFFSEPWPENYAFESATTFTEADHAFLSANKEEFEDRFWTVLLKKNLYLNGFMGPIGMIWTQQAYEEQHTRVKPKLGAKTKVTFEEIKDCKIT